MYSMHGKCSQTNILLHSGCAQIFLCFALFCSNLCLARMLKKVLCSGTLATQGTKNVVCMRISEIWTTSYLISVMVRFDNLKTKEIE